MSKHKMPHNNRVSGSHALKTNDIWTKTIGHNPYAAESEKSELETLNSEKAASILLLAKMSNLGGSDSRGACKRCGMVGHLTFQCRNEVQPVRAAAESTSSDESSSSSDESDRAERRGPDGEGTAHDSVRAATSRDNPRMEMTKKRRRDGDEASDDDKGERVNTSSGHRRDNRDLTQKKDKKKHHKKSSKKSSSKKKESKKHKRHRSS